MPSCNLQWPATNFLHPSAWEAYLNCLRSPISKQMKVRERNACRFNTSRLFDLDSPLHNSSLIYFQRRLGLEVISDPFLFSLSSWSNIPVDSQKRSSRSLRSSPSDSVCVWGYSQVLLLVIYQSLRKSYLSGS